MRSTSPKEFQWLSANNSCNGRYPSLSFHPVESYDLTSLFKAFADVLRDEGLIYAERLQLDGVRASTYTIPLTHARVPMVWTEDRRKSLEDFREALHG